MCRFRYLDLLPVGFVVVLLISNLVGPKICQIGPLRPNSYTLAKLKLTTGGRWLRIRTVGSTVTGQAIDAAVLMAFGGVQPPAMPLRMILSAHLIKVATEVVAMPLTYMMVGWLKRAESNDAYDRMTNFNPFVWREEGA